MKLLKKISIIFLAAFMALSSSNVVLAGETTVAAETEKEVRLQDDFFAAVNKEWLETAKIKPGYTCNDSSVEVDDRCTEQIKALFNELLSKKDTYKSGSNEKNIINFYSNYANEAERNKQGIEPIKAYLEMINKIETIDDVKEYVCSVPGMASEGIFSVGIVSDLKDSNKKVVSIGTTALMLGNSDYYTKPSDYAKMLKSYTDEYLEKLLVLSGYTKEEAAKKVEMAYELEQMIAPAVIGQEEASKESNLDEKLYNIYTMEQLKKAAPNMDIDVFMNKMGLKDVKQVIVGEPKWLTTVNKLYTQENVPLLKNYLEIELILFGSNFLSLDFAQAQVEYAAKITGAEGDLPLEEKALMMTEGIFSDEIGKLYVERHFSKEAKADVEELIAEIIATYKEKIQAVDWMSEPTKKKAIEKLDAMKIKVGYPDKWMMYEGPELKSYEEGGSLLTNILVMRQYNISQAVKNFDKPVDKTVFVMAPFEVNACYNPSANDITFPAGILQTPYYDVNASREANLGAIGVVIGHEISHAFDTSGANFDKDGNLCDWWTKEDYAKFEEKTSKVRAYYSKVKTEDGLFVNGDLTVGENVADITSMSCMLDILKKMDNPDYDAFFRGWATAWRMVSTPELRQLLLESDVHSPNKVRTNVVVAQFQEFYDTYGVKEGDGMYVKPEDRLKIY